MSPQIEKQQFKNTTGGWIGVTVIGPRGEDRGAAVEPDGTVWLSEQEQILTANASRRPEDNPFVAQTRMVTDPETGEQVETTVTPLVPVSENRYVPARERFVPGVLAEGALGTAQAQAAATANDPTTVTSMDAGALQRHAEVDVMGDDALPGHRLPLQEDGSITPPAPPVPPRAAAAAAAAEPPEATQEDYERKVAEEQARQAAAAAATEPTLDAVPPPIEPPAPPEEPSTPPQEPPVLPVQEETAAVVDPSIGEETGAAVTPSGPPVEGEYSAMEEVGTPSAPVVGSPADEDTERDQPPVPYTPPQE